MTTDQEISVMVRAAFAEPGNSALAEPLIVLALTSLNRLVIAHEAIAEQLRIANTEVPASLVN